MHLGFHGAHRNFRDVAPSAGKPGMLSSEEVSFENQMIQDPHGVEEVEVGVMPASDSLFVIGKGGR